MEFLNPNMRIVIKQILRKPAMALVKFVKSLIGEPTREELMEWLARYPRVILDTSQTPVSLQGPECDLVEMAREGSLFEEMIVEIMRLYNVSYISFRIAE